MSGPLVSRGISKLRKGRVDKTIREMGGWTDESSSGIPLYRVDEN